MNLVQRQIWIYLNLMLLTLNLIIMNVDGGKKKWPTYVIIHWQTKTLSLSCIVNDLMIGLSLQLKKNNIQFQYFGNLYVQQQLQSICNQRENSKPYTHWI